MNDRYFLNFWGIGLIAETSNQINETEKALLGKISYFTSALRTVSSAASFPMTLKIDGEEIKEEAVMLLVMNGQYIGTNRIPLPDASIEDGLLDVLICRNTNLTALRELMSMEQGSIDRFTGELSYVQASRIEMKQTLPKRRIWMEKFIHIHPQSFRSCHSISTCLFPQMNNCHKALERFCKSVDSPLGGGLTV